MLCYTPEIDQWMNLTTG